VKLVLLSGGHRARVCDKLASGRLTPIRRSARTASGLDVLQRFACVLVAQLRIDLVHP